MLRHALTSWRMREHVPEAPQPEEIYRLATVGGAKALRQEDRLGSIEAGKLADLLIVDFNEPNVRPLFEQKYVQQLTHSGMASNVLTVLIDGHVVMRERVMKAFREEDVMAEAQAAAAKLGQRMK